MTERGRRNTNLTSRFFFVQSDYSPYQGWDHENFWGRPLCKREISGELGQFLYFSFIPKQYKGKQNVKKHNKFEVNQDLNQAANPMPKARGMLDPEFGFFITREYRMQV